MKALLTLALACVVHGSLAVSEKLARGACVCASVNLNGHARTSPSSRVKVVIPKGQCAISLGGRTKARQDLWYKIQYNGKKVWSVGSFLTVPETCPDIYPSHFGPCHNVISRSQWAASDPKEVEYRRTALDVTGLSHVTGIGRQDTHMPGRNWTDNDHGCDRTKLVDLTVHLNQEALGHQQLVDLMPDGQLDEKINSIELNLAIPFGCPDILSSPTALCPAIISRSQWGAWAPKEIEYLRDSPVSTVLIHHTAMLGCHDRESCITRVQETQRFQMVIWKDWSDISYSFLIGGDGNVYEGRGWDRVGAHTRGYNRIALSFCFMGNYMNYAPHQAQLEALERIIAYGVALGKIRPDYTLRAHKDVSLLETLSPGEHLYNIIKTWPHYTIGSHA